MATFKPFKALRPVSEYASKVAALPYDVMNSEEAREMVKGNPYSFLHVDKAEIDLEKGIDIYSPEVYLKAKENLENLEKNGAMAQDEKPCFYIYRQIAAYGVKVSSLARGLGFGDNLEYADELTLGRSILNRQIFKP